MIDAQAVIRGYAAGKQEVSAVVGSRVYAGVDLPPGYTVGDGEAILLNIRGGETLYVGEVIKPSVQVRCFGESDVEAWGAYRAFYGAMQYKMGKGVRWGQCDVLGQLLKDADTGWPFVISFWTFWLENNS